MFTFNTYPFEIHTPSIDFVICMIHPSDIILQASPAVLRASSRPEERHTHSNLTFVIVLHKSLNYRDSSTFVMRMVFEC